MCPQEKMRYTQHAIALPSWPYFGMLNTNPKIGQVQFIVVNPIRANATQPKNWVGAVHIQQQKLAWSLMVLEHSERGTHRQMGNASKKRVLYN